MTNEELSREWVSSRFWGGWRVGMVDGCGLVCFHVNPEGAPICIEPCDPTWTPRLVHGSCPNLDHPGTLAFLLEDVRRAWEPEGVFYLEYITDGRRRYLGCLDSQSGPANLVGDITELGTLMAALRAAPEKTK